MRPLYSGGGGGSGNGAGVRSPFLSDFVAPLSEVIKILVNLVVHIPDVTGHLPGNTGLG